MLKLNPFAVSQGTPVIGVYTRAYFQKLSTSEMEQFLLNHKSSMNRASGLVTPRKQKLRPAVEGEAPMLR